MPSLRAPDQIPKSPFDLGLTERQAAVLALMMEGKSNKAICRALNLAGPTVKNHVSAILRALNVTSRTEAVIKVGALRWTQSPASKGISQSEDRPESAAAGPGDRRTSGGAAPRETPRISPLELPANPSIVVIPFANLSDDPSQDYFADGMVDEITIALGRIPRLFVIASDSAFAYKGHSVDAKQIGAELGVRYVLRGSVRKESNRLRIVVQLTDAASGGQIWGDRFEGELSRVFDLQDAVAASVSATIAPALQSVEAEHARRKPTDDLTAYDLYLRALPPHRDTLAQNQQSLRLLYRAIELDPSFAAAYGLAAFCHLMQLVFGWQPPREDAVNEGIRLAHLAAEKGENDTEALWMAGRTLAALAGETQHGLSLIGKSTALNPNSARAWWAGGLTHAHLGDAATALDHFERARRLNPLDTSEHAHWTGIALAHLFSGNYQPAMEAVDRALADWPNSPPALRAKAAICGLLGKIEDGHACVRQLLALNPNMSTAHVRALNERQMKTNPSGLGGFLDGLGRAGLPKGEPL